MIITKKSIVEKKIKKIHTNRLSQKDQVEEDWVEVANLEKQITTRLKDVFPAPFYIPYTIN